MSENEKQVGGRHYRDCPIQPWDFIAANDLGFFEGNIVKYITRWRKKGGLKDLEKAQHYLDKLIEIESPVAGCDMCNGEHAAPRCDDTQCWHK